jgi:hypothetical protein
MKARASHVPATGAHRQRTQPLDVYSGHAGILATRREHVDRGDLVTALRSEQEPLSSGYFTLVSLWRGHPGRRARLTSTKLLATSHTNSSTAASSSTP